MSLPRAYWVKFQDGAPQLWYTQNGFDQFWHDLRDYMIRTQAILEWVIVD